MLPLLIATPTSTTCDLTTLQLSYCQAGGVVSSVLAREQTKYLQVDALSVVEA